MTILLNHTGDPYHLQLGTLPYPLWACVPYLTYANNVDNCLSTV